MEVVMLNPAIQGQDFLCDIEGDAAGRRSVLASIEQAVVAVLLKPTCRSTLVTSA